MLHGPLPTTVKASITVEYIVNGASISIMIVVVKETSWNISPLSMSDSVTLTVYPMIFPFCWSRGGGVQLMTALMDVTSDAVTFWGYPLGTI